MIQIIDKIKLLFRKEKGFYNDLHAILGFYPRHIEYYKVAFTHRSNNQQAKQNRRRFKKGEEPRTSDFKAYDNERLEFLGDAVLETVVSEILYHRYPKKKEGFLTSTRSKLVARETLGKLAKELNLERFMKLPKNSGQRNSYAGGNAFEALVGAIFLDRGYRYAYHFIKHLIKTQIVDVDSTAKKEVNFKSRLLEYCQKNRILYSFENESQQEDRQAAPVFISRVLIEALLAGEGSGLSKKESEQNAAKAALVKMRREKGFIDSILRSKESRTAMEAPEFGALPRIREIDDEVRRLNKLEREEKERQAAEPKAERSSRKAERHVKARERKAAQQFREAQQAQQAIEELQKDLSSESQAAIEQAAVDIEQATTHSSQAEQSHEKPVTIVNKPAARDKRTATASPKAAHKVAQARLDFEEDIVAAVLSPIPSAMSEEVAAETSEEKSVQERKRKEKAVAPQTEVTFTTPPPQSAETEETEDIKYATIIPTAPQAKNKGKMAVRKNDSDCRNSEPAARHTKQPVEQKQQEILFDKQPLRETQVSQKEVVSENKAAVPASSKPAVAALVSALRSTSSPTTAQEKPQAGSLEEAFAQKAQGEAQQTTKIPSTVAPSTEKLSSATPPKTAPTLSVADLISQLAAAKPTRDSAQPAKTVTKPAVQKSHSEKKAAEQTAKTDSGKTVTANKAPAIADLLSAMSTAPATTPHRPATIATTPQGKQEEKRATKAAATTTEDTPATPEASSNNAAATDNGKRRRKKVKPEMTPEEAAAELEAIKAAALREIQASNGRMYE